LGVLLLGLLAVVSADARPYTSQARASTESRSGIAPGAHMTATAHAGRPWDAGACTARDVRQPRSRASTAHPTPANLLFRANLDA
jgi:hypothetical protein